MSASRLSIYARLALLAAAATLTACAPTRDYYEPTSYYDPYDEHYGDYYDYWYYPAVGAYYDPRVNVYFYYEHDHWTRSRALPPHYRPYLGKYVVVRSVHDRPYEYHHRHRERYSPERYTSSKPDYRNKDVWIGAPRNPRPERDRHEGRYDDDRRSNGRYQHDDRDGDRRYAPAGRQDKAPVRATITEQSRQSSDRREPPAGAVPVKQQNKEQAREKSNDAARNGKPKNGEQPGNGRDKNDPDSGYRPRGPEDPHDNDQ